MCVCFFRCFFQQLRGISGGSSRNKIFTEVFEWNKYSIICVENCQEHVQIWAWIWTKIKKIHWFLRILETLNEHVHDNSRLYRGDFPFNQEFLQIPSALKLPPEMLLSASKVHRKRKYYAKKSQKTFFSMCVLLQMSFSTT